MEQVLIIRQINFFMSIEFFFNLSPLARREKKALKVLHEFTANVITARREQLEKSKEDPVKAADDDDDVGRKKKMVFLDILLQSKIGDRPLTDLEIRENVDAFLFGGLLQTCFMLSIEQLTSTVFRS